MKNRKANLPVGIFDSGLGGLTVLAEAIKALPQEDFVYLGDTAHLPYGTKSKEVIIKLAINNILFLLRQKVKFVIVACNTTSAVALPYIQSYFNVPLLGVVEAGVKAAANSSLNPMGVIGTPATIASRAYQNALQRANQKLKVYSTACPLFVPLAEEGLHHSPLAEAAAELYLGKYRGKINGLILGCTHYPLLKKVISNTLPQVQLFDSSVEVVRLLRWEMTEQRLLKGGKQRGKITIFLTDNAPYFSRLAYEIIKRRIKPLIVNNV